MSQPTTRQLAGGGGALLEGVFGVGRGGSWEHELIDKRGHALVLGAYLGRGRPGWAACQEYNTL